METALYSITGKKTSTLTIPDAVFGIRWNPDLVHQVVESERSNQRTLHAKVKMRGEVRGGGKKPWRQKGTGRARHGSIRSPIWIGGGATHGPTLEKITARKINRTVAKRAVATVLSAKFRDHEVLFLDSAAFDTHKTRRAAEMMKALSTNKEFQSVGRKGGRALIALPAYSENAVRAVRNLSHVAVKDARMLQALDLLSNKFIIIPKETVAVLERLLTSKKK
mgnify:CR=1 FL=1